MAKHGISIKNASEGKRITLGCDHNSGVIYIVPSEASWVCSQENIAAHTISGFFRDLIKLENSQIDQIMQKWGLYYRGLEVIDPDPS